MIEMRKHIRQSLSIRLSLDILFLVILVFTLSLATGTSATMGRVVSFITSSRPSIR